MALYTACIYKDEDDFDRGRLHYSESFETIEEAEALCETYTHEFPGSFALTYIEEEDCLL